MKLFIISIYILFIASINGCIRVDSKEASKSLIIFWNYYKQSNFDGMIDSYSKTFITNENKNNIWKNDLLKLKSEFGSMLEYQLIESRSFNSTNEFDYVELIYNVQYEKISLKHTIVCILEDKQYKILKHYIKD